MNSQTSSKFLDLDELAVRLGELKRQGRKIVLSHGVFDLLHVGHIRHFEEAKKMGDVLVVTLTQDEYVNKGPHRPAFPQQLRAESVAALGVVDFVSINRWPVSVETIRLLKPDIYAKGPDYKVAAADVTGAIQLEAQAVADVGGEIRFTDDITFSSSRFLNQFFSPFTPEIEDYLDAFRKHHSSDELLQWLEKASRVRPLAIGEAIIDEYVFCVGIGKSTKDPVLAVLQESFEPVAGGTLAIANHLAGLCNDVALITQVGDTDEHAHFVRSSLRSNVHATILTKKGCPTVAKRRIVDRYSGNKLLEIYSMDDRPSAGADAESICHALDRELGRWDATVVADYGHGMISRPIVDKICNNTRFLALNVQSNAGNRGFNTVSKYRRASYVCLAEHEIQIEIRHRYADVKDAILEASRRIQCDRFTVTIGNKGSVHFDRSEGFTEVPALATKIRDRVGAGDAVLAVTSLLAYVGAPWEIAGFIGNVAGAEVVAELGSRVPLDRVSLSKHIISLLK